VRAAPIPHRGSRCGGVAAAATFAGQLEVTERSGNYLLYELALGAQWSWGDVRLGVEYGNTDPAIGNTRVVLAFGVNVFDLPR
jgi:hypothetical protein